MHTGDSPSVCFSTHGGRPLVCFSTHGVCPFEWFPHTGSSPVCDQEDMDDMVHTKFERSRGRPTNILYFSYSVGGLAEAGLYQYITTFQLIFLTGVVKIPPAVAGTITSAAILLEAICCFVVGHLSDSLRWRYGRRRPFILLTAFLLPSIS